MFLKSYTGDYSLISERFRSPGLLEDLRRHPGTFLNQGLLADLGTLTARSQHKVTALRFNSASSAGLSTGAKDGNPTNKVGK